MDSKRIIVVLAMHRSGSSVITRSLKALGVNLGNNLMPASPDNLKGYWEDLDINTLNIEMLASIGKDWHSLNPISEEHIKKLIAGYLPRARNLLHRKFADCDIFGFKDPRVAQLLPFWHAVLNDEFDVSYVLALRNPMSVCKSLNQREGFELEKGYILWLEHVINSLDYVNDANGVIVDYDVLLQSPLIQLQRIATHLNLELDQEGELPVLLSEFLDSGLRHHFYDAEQLKRAHWVPNYGKEIYLTLLAISQDELSIQSAQKDMQTWQDMLATIMPFCALVDNRDQLIHAATLSILERDHQIQTLTLKANAFDEILKSKTWKLVTFLSQMRSKIVKSGHYE